MISNLPIRIHFSCGAASATSLFLACETGLPVSAVYADTGGEHPDNARFLNDCERATGVKIDVVRSATYASPLDVWRRRKFIKSNAGAICTSELKRIPLKPFWTLDHQHIFGFIAGEEHRLSRIQANEAPFVIRSLLIERRWRKGDCFDFIQSKGIELPEMYRLGFNNANCIGCPKGGAGYWNHVRKVFPDHFEQVAALQDELGPSTGFFQSPDGSRQSLRQLPQNAGNHKEPDIECGLFCVDHTAL